MLQEQEGEEGQEEEQAGWRSCAQRGQLNQVQVCVKVTGSVTVTMDIRRESAAGGFSRTRGGMTPAARGINLLMEGL